MKLLILFFTLFFTRHEKVLVPVICYHQISQDNRTNDALHVSVSQLASQLKALRDSGYETVTPEALYRHQVYGSGLPAKPIIISFDDSRASHALLAAPLLERYGFRGVFFIMTVTLGKPGYLSAAQVKQLHHNGHTIGAHSYDHPNVQKLTTKHWAAQLLKPKQTLEAITGAAVTAFAYPYGSYNRECVRMLQSYGYSMAFCLLNKDPCDDPLFCIRRMMVNGAWSGTRLLRAIDDHFRK